jgi:hypothetical protein
MPRRLGLVEVHPDPEIPPTQLKPLVVLDQARAAATQPTPRNQVVVQGRVAVTEIMRMATTTVTVTATGTTTSSLFFSFIADEILVFVAQTCRKILLSAGRDSKSA